MGHIPAGWLQVVELFQRHYFHSVVTNARPNNVMRYGVSKPTSAAGTLSVTSPPPIIFARNQKWAKSTGNGLKRLRGPYNPPIFLFCEPNQN